MYDPLAIARELFRDQPPGFPYENFAVEELILPDGDDMGIKSEEDDVDEEEVETESGFGTVVGEALAGEAARGPRTQGPLLTRLFLPQLWTTYLRCLMTSTRSSSSCSPSACTARSAPSRMVRPQSFQRQQ